MLWLLVVSGSAAGSPAPRLPDEVAVLSVNEIDGEVWLGTSNGAYRLEGDSFQKAAGVNGSVWGVYPDSCGNERSLTLVTGCGTRTIPRKGAPGIPTPEIRLPPLQGAEPWPCFGQPTASETAVIEGIQRETSINHITRDRSGALWLATDRGAYEIADGTVKTHVLPEVQVSEIIEAGGRIWFRETRETWYRREGNSVPPDPLVLRRPPLPVGDSAWLATESGAIEFANGITRRHVLPGKDVRRIEVVAGRIYFWTDAQWYQLRGDQAEGVIAIDAADECQGDDVDIAGATGEATWWSSGDCDALWRIDERQTRRFTGLGRVRLIKEEAGRVWVLSDDGLFRMEGDVPTRLVEETSVMSVQSLGDAVWATASDGVYRIHADRVRHFPLEPGTLGIAKIVMAGSSVWLGRDKGLTRVTGEEIRSFLDDQTMVDIVPQGDAVWVATLNDREEPRVYRIDRDTVREVYRGGDVAQMRLAGGWLWLVTTAGQALRLQGNEVETLNHPPRAPNSKMVLRARVVGAPRIEEDASGVTVKVDLDLHFANEGDSFVFLLRPEFQTHAGSFWIGGVELFASARGRRPALVDQAAWPSNYFSSRWSRLMCELDTPSPPPEAFVRIPPGEAWTFRTSTSLWIAKKQDSIRKQSTWGEVRSMKTPWMVVTAEVWPINLAHGDLRFDGGRFKQMLRRRWRPWGCLSPMKLSAKPFPLDLTGAESRATASANQ